MITEDIIEKIPSFLNLDLNSQETLLEIADAVKNLHKTFISDDQGDHGNNYGEKHRKRMGYTLYYLLANLPKIEYIINRHIPDLGAIESVLDVGAGPGTASLAFLSTLYTKAICTNPSIMLLDHSQSFLNLAKYLLKNWSEYTGSTPRIRTILTDLKSRKIPNIPQSDLVIFSNIITELPSNEAISVIQRWGRKLMKPAGRLLIMEPSTMKESRMAILLRNTLIQNGWFLEGPCPGDYPCPALNNPRDWCHCRLAWNEPALLQRIDDMAGLKKNVLNFTYFVFTSVSNGSNIRKDASHYLAVSDLLESKGKWELWLCGRKDKWCCVLEKKRLNSQNQCFLGIRRFDTVTIDRVNYQNHRIIIDQSSRITVYKHSEIRKN